MKSLSRVLFQVPYCITKQCLVIIWYPFSMLWWILQALWHLAREDAIAWIIASTWSSSNLAQVGILQKFPCEYEVNVSGLNLYVIIITFLEKSITFIHSFFKILEINCFLMFCKKKNPIFGILYQFGLKSCPIYHHWMCQTIYYSTSTNLKNKQL